MSRSGSRFTPSWLGNSSCCFRNRDGHDLGATPDRVAGASTMPKVKFQAKPSPVPVGLTPAALEAKARFDQQFRAYALQARQEFALTVLVWGPSPTAETPVARKREEIRDELLRLGFFAAFSED